jgi:hypothetical protein
MGRFFSSRAWGSLALCAIAALVLSAGLLGRIVPTTSAAPARGGPHAGVKRPGLQHDLNAMLARVAGPGKAFVVVNQTTSNDRISAIALRYTHRGVVLSSTGTATGWTGASSGAVHGASTQWGHGQTVTSTQRAPGATKRMDIALVVDRSISKKTARQLTRAVATAAGLRRARGDRITTLRTKLPPASAAASTKAPAWLSPTVTYGRIALLSLGVLAFLAFTTADIRAAGVMTARGR